MTSPRGSDHEFRQLTAMIARDQGIRCDAYKEKCLRRRIAVRMRARGAHTFDAYRELLGTDRDEYEHLLDALTINVTKFYRNPETWEVLATRYLPSRWQEHQGHVRCWSAACASGEEPYSLSIALAEVARATKTESWLSRARIDATDIDRASLDRARSARYSRDAFAEMPPRLFRRYFRDGPPFRVPDEVRGRVRILAHDLTQTPPPFAPYHVILCRNVVIYFDRAMQERLFESFVEALAPRGLLVLGKVETLSGSARSALTLEEPRERIYSKPA